MRYWGFKKIKCPFMEQIKLYYYYSFIFYFKKMQRVALINWKNINQDSDLSKILESITTFWVVKGLEVQTNKITTWYWFIEIERDWKTLFILFENTEVLDIDTTWTKKIFIEINSANINDWNINNEVWSNIWEIKIADDYPNKNYLKLANINNWKIKDERSLLKIKDEIFTTSSIYKKDEVFNKVEANKRFYTKTDADSRFVNIDNDETITWKKTFEKKIEVWNKNHTIEEKNGNLEITTSWKIKVKSEELEIDGIITTNKEQSEKINAYVRKDYVDNLLAIAGWWWFKAVSEVKYGNNGKLQEFMWDGKKYTLTYSNKWQLIWVNNWEQEFEIKYNNKWELYSIKLK